MCNRTSNHFGWSHGSASCCTTGANCCQPCLPSRDEETSKLEHCRDKLQKKLEAVEERLSLFKNAR
jgi:hypothetical protein